MKPYLLALLLSVISLSAAEYSYSFGSVSLWDLTGVYTNVGASGEQTFTLNHKPSGDVSGSYSETYHGTSSSLVGSGPLTGKVISTAKGLKLKTRLDFFGTGTFEGGRTADVTVRGPGLFLLQGRSLDAVFIAQLCAYANGQSACRRAGMAVDGLQLKDDMTGQWTLGLNVDSDGTAVSGTAVVTLSNGRAFSFQVAGRQGKSGLTSLALTGTGEAAGVKMRVTMDGAYQITKLTGRLLGQTLSIRR